MATYTATVAWERGAAKFTDNRYPRAHRWTFDGGAVVLASSSPHVVPVPLSDAAAVDPEEAFVASLSSCHMLYFLFFAAKRGFIVDAYVDRPIGYLEKNEEGRSAMTRVVLKPEIQFSGEKAPTPTDLKEMHDLAHRDCYIANSVKSIVTVEA